MTSFRVWAALCSPENLWAAWRDFERGKRRRPAVATFGLEAPSRAIELHAALRAGTWEPGGYRLLRIRDPKRRIVAAAPVADRVVHHAIHRVLAPLYNRSFIEQSFACIPGRGSHRAVLCFLAYQRRYRYALHLDIRRYFYSIDRACLKDLLWRRLREPEPRTLLEKILESGASLYQDPRVVSYLGWEGPVAVGRGLPIGNLTSQWWGNLYLDGLDHFVRRELRIPAYLRYMDDFVLFSDGVVALQQARDAVAEWLMKQRGLELKDPGASPLRTRRTWTWLGYRISRSGVRTGDRMRARLPLHLRRVVFRPTSAKDRLTAIAAAWTFG